MSDPTPYDNAQAAAARLAELTGVERHDIALVLGSGWLPAVDALGEATAEIDTTDLPGLQRRRGRRAQRQDPLDPQC